MEDTEPLAEKYSPLANRHFADFMKARHTSGIWTSVDEDCEAYDAHVALQREVGDS